MRSRCWCSRSSPSFSSCKIARRSATGCAARERADESRWRVLRHRLAETWHILAIVYVVGTFGVYVLNAQGGLALLLRATALSLVVISAAAILVAFRRAASRRSFAVEARR